MNRRLAVLLLVLAASAPPLRAQYDGVPRPGMMTRGAMPGGIPPQQLAQVEFEQRLGAQVPLDLPFLDESGRPVRLSQYFNGRPVVLALVYYRCPLLCTQALSGLVRSLKVLALEPGRDYNVVTVGFDPAERPVEAAEKKDHYLQILRRPGAGDSWHFLTGPSASIGSLTGAVGFHYVFDEQRRQYAHPTGIVVLTPEGRVSKYIYGIDYEPRDLRLALVEASDHRIGTPVDRRLLYCYRHDPASGQYGRVLMSALRLAGAVTVACLVGLILFLLRNERQLQARWTPAHHLDARGGPASWLLTTDHKRIALLFLVGISAFFVAGGALAGAIRLELLTAPGDLVSDDAYNRLFTTHGVVMVFLFLIPSIPAVFGNFFVPVMIGARGLAFPRLNLLSWYIYLAGAVCTLAAVALGGVDTGWTFYAPFGTHASQGNVVMAAVGVFIIGLSSILTGINFLVTIHTMRAPGLAWFGMPLFPWAVYATSIISVLGTPVLAVTLVAAATERAFHLGIFDATRGGDPVLFQHLFWFYSHPAVYVAILPSMGVVSELVAAFSRRNIVGHTVVASSSLAVATLGVLVWGHHVFVAGSSAYGAMAFSVLSFLVAVPLAVTVFSWTATLCTGSISFQAPMLYALGSIGLFTVGGLTGLFLASLGAGVRVSDTSFVVAHFHYIMAGGALMGYLGALHYWWPKMTGRLYSDRWGRIGAVSVCLGFNLAFFPQFILGCLGMPRRCHAYPPEFQALNVLSTAGASVLALGCLMPAFYLLWSLKFGERAGRNPWGATGLEWTTASPPPAFNFEETPVVTAPACAHDRQRDSVTAP